MVIFNGSKYEQSSLHILESMVPEAVSDDEMILHTMICCRGIMRWDGRRRSIVVGHTLLGIDLAELLQYTVLPYHKDIPKTRGIDSFTKGLARIGGQPRHIGNQCIRLVVETGNNTQNALEPEYDSQEESDTDTLIVESDVERRDFPS